MKDTASRGKRDLEVAGAQVAGKPSMPRRTGQGGIITSGAEVAGAEGLPVLFDIPAEEIVVAVGE